MLLRVTFPDTTCEMLGTVWGAEQLAEEMCRLTSIAQPITVEREEQRVIGKIGDEIYVTVEWEND